MRMELPSHPREKWTLTPLQPYTKLVCYQTSLSPKLPGAHTKILGTGANIMKQHIQPGSWASSASEKDASATSSVQNSFRSAQ